MEGIVEDFPSRCIIVSISPELNSRWLPKNSLPKANTVPHQQWNPAHSRQLSLSAPTSSLNSRSTIFSFLSILAASCAENNLLLNSSLVCVFQFQSEWIRSISIQRVRRGKTCTPSCLQLRSHSRNGAAMTERGIQLDREEPNGEFENCNK